MICKIRKKNGRGGAARQTRPEAPEKLRLAQRAAKRQRAAQRASQRLREAQRDSDGLRGALTSAEWPLGGMRVFGNLHGFLEFGNLPGFRGSRTLRQGQSGSEQLWTAPRCPGGPRAAPRGSERKRNSGKQKILNLRGIYHDKWCQNSSFDIICHDILLAKNWFSQKIPKL